ncbi:hypothetical protein DOE76_05430 [Leifsonia sp. ku-ls]|nr:hypothetical protein DOE76_05430 [Leifsonia sp. ku-ls]
MTVSRASTVRRRRATALIAACAAIGVVAGALLVPRFWSNAGTNGVSTLYKTGTNTTNGSVAASTGAPGGAKTGTGKPGDTIDWVVDYRNETGKNGTVDLRDPLTNAGTYVPGSLKLPAAQIPGKPFAAQFSTNGGGAWQAGSPPANANGVGFTGGAASAPGGLQAQLGDPFQKPAGFAFNQNGGDAYNGVVAQVNGQYQVYTSYHHNTSQATLVCVTPSGGVCPGWPATYTYASTTPGLKIGTGPYANMATTWENGTFLVGTTLFWEAQTTVPDGTGKYPVGFMCADIVTLVSCGFHPVDKVNYAPFFSGTNPQISGTGIPAANGKYYFATANGKILCFDPSTFVTQDVASTGLCGSFDVGGITGSDRPPHTATYGDYFFAAIVTSPVGAPAAPDANPNIYCYRISTNSLCPGFPKAFANGVPWGSAAHGALAPMLNTAGAITGICSLQTNTPGVCWNLSGASVASPYPTSAGFNDGWAGDSLLLGTKVYVPVSNDSAVGCFDFSKISGGLAQPCTGFTPPPNPYNYTSRTIAGVPGCLIATGDGRLMNTYDANTGGACLSTFASTRVAPASSYCGSGAAGFRGWGTLNIVDTPTTSYKNAIVTIYDVNRQPVSGFDGVSLPAGTTSLDISSIPPTGATAVLTVEVTLQGVVDQDIAASGGTVSVSWKGDPPQMCFSTKVPDQACDAPQTDLFNQANAVTVSPAGTDGPSGNTTDKATFAVKTDPSQCGIAFAKTSPVQKVGPGDKVAYAITVKNTGSQAYQAASFTDDLTDVLKDATYNGDHAATAGTATYSAPILSWTGPLAVGATATVTYSVTVKNPADGDHSMVNRIVSNNQGSNCLPGSTDAACQVVVDVDVKDVTWHKVDDSKNLLEGSEWTFTPVDAQGKPIGAPITVTDCVATSAADCTGADKDQIAGEFRLTNLGAGTYQLVETKAPLGFRLDSKPITVTIVAASTTVSLADVINKQLPVPAIPFTGGIGADTYTFAGLGVLLLVAALAFWQVMRRRRTV